MLGALSSNIRLRFIPCLRTDLPSHNPTLQVPVLEVDASIATGDTSLISCIREGSPGESYVRGRHRTALYERGSF